MLATSETQCAMILSALQDGRRLSPLDALKEFGCFRLAAVVHVLRAAGHNIITDMGNKYAIYHMPALRGEQLQLADFGRPNTGY